MEIIKCRYHFSLVATSEREPGTDRLPRKLRYLFKVWRSGCPIVPSLAPSPLVPIQLSWDDTGIGRTSGIIKSGARMSSISLAELSQENPAR